MRVVFMGTPDISATCLKKILADGFEVVARRREFPYSSRRISGRKRRWSSFGN